MLPQPLSPPHYLFHLCRYHLYRRYHKPQTTTSFLCVGGRSSGLADRSGCFGDKFGGFGGFDGLSINGFGSFVIHVLGFDPHAFTHFRDERKRRRSQVTKQIMDEKLGRTVTHVVLPRVVMYSRYHHGATPPSAIKMIGENKTAPKLQSKRKNVYVSRDTMQKQARMKSQKSLNY
ncbi:hypothetical protein Tco_1498982 [Tanacetum coccineum]